MHCYCSRTATSRYCVIQNKRSLRIKRSGVRTTGTITAISGQLNREDNPVNIQYYVIGTSQIINKRFLAAGLPYKVGDRLPLYYDRGNPNKMLMGSGEIYNLLLIFTVIIAVAFIILGSLIVRDGFAS